MNVLVSSSEKNALDHSYCSKASSLNMSREHAAFCDPEVMAKVFSTKVLTAEDILRKFSGTKEEQEDVEKKTRD